MNQCSRLIIGFVIILPPSARHYFEVLTKISSSRDSGDTLPIKYSSPIVDVSNSPKKKFVRRSVKVSNI
jgi:hypothetical protein